MRLKNYSPWINVILRRRKTSIDFYYEQLTNNVILPDTVWVSKQAHTMQKKKFATKQKPEHTLSSLDRMYQSL